MSSRIEYSASLPYSILYKPKKTTYHIIRNYHEKNHCHFKSRPSCCRYDYSLFTQNLSSIPRFDSRSNEITLSVPFIQKERSL